MIKTIKYLLFLGVSCMLLLEVALRIYNPIYVPIRSDQIKLPIDRVFTQRNTNNPKVDEFQTYRYNGIGLRGPEFPADPKAFTKIFTVGGSTTACVELTDGRTWPDQLLARLQQATATAWLNNAGQNGHSTFGHLILLEQHLKKFNPDLILYLVGVNDVERDDINSFDARMIGRNETLRNRIVARSELLSTAQVIKGSLLAYDLGVNSFFPLDLHAMAEVAATDEEIAEELERHRRNYLGPYRARLEELVTRTREAGAEPVFITQPALYGGGTDETTGLQLDQLRTSRAGLPGHAEWLVLELYNDVTRAVAAQNKLLLIDLAAELPKDSAYYFDWIHYSNAGAELVAEIINKALLASPLLDGNAATNAQIADRMPAT